MKIFEKCLTITCIHFCLPKMNQKGQPSTWFDFVDLPIIVFCMVNYKKRPYKGAAHKEQATRNGVLKTYT